jgi:uncharacterized peroxidase-related enzyme
MSLVPSIPESEESVSAVMRRYPEQAVSISQLTEAVMRTGDCALTSEQRELIAAYSSGVNNCTYCYNTHRVTAEAFGVDEGLLELMLADLETAPVDEKLKPLLRYAKKLTLTPTRMVQADADAIFDAGWDEDVFHYTVMICGLFNFYNRLIEGYGVKNTTEFRLAAGRELMEKGYSVVLEKR